MYKKFLKAYSQSKFSTFGFTSEVERYLPNFIENLGYDELINCFSDPYEFYYTPEDVLKTIDGYTNSHIVILYTNMLATNKSNLHKAKALRDFSRKAREISIKNDVKLSFYNQMNRSYGSSSTYGTIAGNIKGGDGFLYESDLATILNKDLVKVIKNRFDSDNIEFILKEIIREEKLKTLLDEQN